MATFVADRAGLVVHVNPAWTTTVRTRSPSHGETLWACLGGEIGDRLRQAWARGAAELCVEGTTGVIGPDAPYLRVQAHRTESGTVVGFVRDVTEERRRERVRQQIAAWSKRLHLASTFGELVALAEQEAQIHTRYNNYWLFIRPTDDSPVVRRLGSSGTASAVQWEHAPTLDVATDALVQAVIDADGPVVVEDARTDPRTNKDLVAAIGNRTIINIPLVLLDQCLGAFGMGSFNDEGVCLPTAFELEILEAMAGQIAVAAGRLRFVAERRGVEEERRRLELRLLRAQNMESLRVLAGGVAHDVNNLMTIVVASLAEAGQGIGGEHRARPAIERAEIAALRTSELATQMLAYAGSGGVSCEIADVTTLARETTTLARVSAHAQAEVCFSGVEEQWVAGDLTQLRQLVMNLVTNALEAIGDDAGRVGVTVRPRVIAADQPDDGVLGPVEPGPYVEIEVADDGAGMTEATLERLFDPFFTTKATGRGLGMSAVLGVVRGHGGAMWVDTAPGRGTTFSIALPQAPAPAQLTSQDSTTAAPTTPTTAPTPASELVLVADDEDGVRALARSVLEHGGFEVVEARDGKEALQVFDTHGGRVVAVVLDAMMPELTGAEVLAKLRTHSPDLPVILSSGYADAGPGAGQATALLGKPWYPQQLVDAVRSAIDGE